VPDLLSPVVSAVAAVLTTAHSAASALGLAPGSPGAWLVAVGLLVVAVRTALLPLTVHGVRAAHARARATPALRELRSRYAGTRDLDRLRAMREEQRSIRAEHGVSSWSLAPALLQLPLVYALYRVVADLANGHAVGALDAGLVASASAASVYGLHLTTRLGPALGSGAPGLVLVGLAVLAAALSLATQRWFALPNADLTDVPDAVAGVQRLVPWLGAAGVLAAAAFVPAGVLLYWVLTNAWTFAQQGLVARFWPTPGTPAAARRVARLASSA